MNTATNTPAATENPVAHLSQESLNARAAKAVETIAKAGICLRDHEWPAYQAAQLRCAHLGHVETLEALARRAVRVMIQAPVIRFK